MVTAFASSLKKWIQKYKSSKKISGKINSPGKKASHSSLLSAYRNSGVGYKSEYESENDTGAASDSNIGSRLVDQDNEDWGVNTLHQATDLLKNLIGIGANQVRPSNTENRGRISAHSISSIPFSGANSGDDSLQNHQPQQFSHQVGGIQNHQANFPQQLQQLTAHQNHIQNTSFGSQSILQNIPLQGIITTADGTNTHAMIQILPFSPNGNDSSANLFLQQNRTGSRSNSVHSATEVAALQRESLLELLKGSKLQQQAAANQQYVQPLHQSQQRSQSRQSLNLKNMPPPPTIQPHSDVMSEEIRASYGGGGGGPTVKFRKSSKASNAPFSSENSTIGFSESHDQKNALLNILTKGPAVAIQSSKSLNASESASILPNNNQTRTSIQPDVKSKDKMSEIEANNLTIAQTEQQLLNLLMNKSSSQQPPQDLPPATLRLENGVLKPVEPKLKVLPPNGIISPKIYSKPAISDEDETDDDVQDFATLRAPQSRNIVQTTIAPPRKTAAKTSDFLKAGFHNRISESLNDPWANLPPRAPKQEMPKSPSSSINVGQQTSATITTFQQKKFVEPVEKKILEILKRSPAEPILDQANDTGTSFVVEQSREEIHTQQPSSGTSTLQNDQLSINLKQALGIN
ncbi:hypothetical protein HK100_003181, partial [Physocladia obscura]